MDHMKNFTQLKEQVLEEKVGTIYDKTPKTIEDAENPEVLVQGFGRVRLNQVHDLIQKKVNELSKLSQSKNYNGMKSTMKMLTLFMDAADEVEKEMNTSQYKRKLTMLRKVSR